MKKLLAIDDQIDNLLTIQAVLKLNMPDIKILTALSGKEGIEIARKEQPDSILLDIIMPEMDGFETCKRLKIDELTKHIPVAMITAIKTDAKSRIKALDIGADTFLSKPIDHSELTAQVKVMLRIKAAEDKIRAEKEDLEEQVEKRTAELNKSEKKFRELFEKSNDSILILKNRKFIDCNQATIDLLAYKTKEEFLNLHPSKVSPTLQPDGKSSFEKAEEMMDIAVKNGTHRFEWNHVDRNGNLIPTEVLLTAISTERDNEIIHTVWRDITKRKRAETKIRESEEKFRNLIEFAPNAFFQGDAAGDFIMVNNQAVNLTGYSKDELLSMNMKDLFSETELSEKTLIYEKLQQGETVNQIRKLIKKNHKEIFVEMNSKAMPDGTYQSFMTDITERMQSDTKIKKLSTAVEQSPSVIVITDLKGSIEYVNPKFSELTGYHIQEVIGQNPRILKSGKQSKDVYKKMWKTISSGKKWRGEFHNKKKNGDLFWESVSLSPIFDKKGRITNYLKVAEDITDQKLAETKLRESEIRFKALHNASFGGIAIHNKGIIKECNQGLSDISGYTLKKLIGMDGLLLIAEHSREEVMNNILASYEKPYEVIGLRKNGEEYPLKLEARNIPYHGKEMRVVEFRDITDQKRAEQIQKVLYNISNAVNVTDSIKDLIQIIQKELGTIIDTANFYVALYNKDSGTLSAPYMADEKDYFPTFPAKKTITNYVIQSQKSLLAHKDKTKKMIKDGDIELVGQAAEIWLGVPLKVEGNTIGVIAVQSYTNENAYDEDDVKMLEFIADQISIAIHRKNAEDLLKKSEERFDLAMKASKDGIYDWDLISNEIYYSASWKKIIGYTDNELANDISVWESLTHPEDRELSLLKLKEAISKKIDHYNIEFRMKHKDSYWVNILSRAQIIYNKEGKAIRAVGTLFDLTEQKKAEQKIKEALKKAEESDRLKSAFLANMSHEIRTPMNGILGFANLLKESELVSEEQQEYVKIINRSGNRMLNIINNIVDISKIEAGQMTVRLSKFDVNKQLNFLHSFFSPEIDKKGLEFLFENDFAHDTLVIESDKEKFIAILTNLVKNAIKYTNKGSIKFGCRLKSVREQNELEFFVKDTGIGIPENRQKAIFDRFIQADIEDKEAYEGAGLGLAISKAYAEMIGGKIGVISVDGKGSEFYFSLPYVKKVKEENIEDNSSKTDSTLNSKKLTVLIAEDDKTSEFYLKTLIHKASKEILYARTGKEAVDICQDNPHIDLVLMDIKMPEMDGFEATKQIRGFNKDIIIIAQTAYAQLGDREKAIEVGCNDYVSKPIKKEVLMNLIWKYLK